MSESEQILAMAQEMVSLAEGLVLADRSGTAYNDAVGDFKRLIDVRASRILKLNP